jgi:outer membrane protein TolC
MKVPKVFGMALVVAIASPAYAETLTLERAIHLAMTRNERAAIADLGVTASEAELSATRTLFLPAIDLAGQAAYRPRNDPPTSAQASAALTQPLFAPSAFPLYSQAKHELTAQRAQRIDERRRLAFDTANAFMAVLLADQVVQAAQRKLETATSNLATTDAQMQAQLVSSNDVTRAQISLASAMREVASSKGNLQAAYIELELLVSSRVTDGVAPPAALLDAGRTASTAPGDLVAGSASRRPDLAATREQALAAHDFAREPRQRYLPAFDLGAQVSAVAPAGNSGNHLDGLIAVTARWTIFDSGERAATARAREARAKIADFQAAQLARTIDAEVRAAAVLLASRQEALAAAGKARDAARKGADEATILYKQGLAKAIELVDANEQRFIAEVNYATSEFDVARAYLSLRLAMGLDPLEGVR